MGSLKRLKEIYLKILSTANDSCPKSRMTKKKYRNKSTKLQIKYFKLLCSRVKENEQQQQQQQKKQIYANVA